MQSLLTALILFTTLPVAFAQQSPEVGGVKLYRYGELLRDHNIELTEPALLRALKNPDAAVRYLAAMKLAEDKATDAIPAIEQALAVEKVPRDRVNIAVALGLLGDQTGHAELKKVCADKNFIPESRLYAVRYMFDLHSQDEHCLHAAEDIVESRKVKFGDRISALELLPQFQHLTEDESQRVFELVVNCLQDPEPVVRMAASDALAGLGNPSGISYLEAAIARESEEGTRSAMERDLKKLQPNAKE